MKVTVSAHKEIISQMYSRLTCSGYVNSVSGICLCYLYSPRFQILYKLSFTYTKPGMSALERKSWDETKKELKKKYLPTYVVSLSVGLRSLTSLKSI